MQDIVDLLQELAWFLPFLTLQGRLGRKDPTVEVQSEVPVAYVAFDLLAVGPRSGQNGANPEVVALLTVPLAERRRRLESLALPTVDEVFQEVEAGNAEPRGHGRMRMHDGPDLPLEFKMAAPKTFDTLFAQSVAIMGYPGTDTTTFACGRCFSGS